MEQEPSTQKLFKLFILNCFLCLCYIAGAAYSAEANYQSGDNLTTSKSYTLEPGVVLSNKSQDGASLINKMLNAASDLDNYTADYKMTVHKEQQLITETGSIYFRKPRLFRVEVKTGPKKGALAILCSDGKVHGHLGGVMKYFTAALSPDSSLVKAINGFPMCGTDFYSLADYLKNMLNKGALSACTIEPVITSSASMPVYVLDMYVWAAKNSGKRLLLKRIFVDSKSYLPVYWQDYIDEKLWSESSWNHFQNNISLSTYLFSP